VAEGGLFNTTGSGIATEMWSRGLVGPSQIALNQQYRLLYTCVIG